MDPEKRRQLFIQMNDLLVGDVVMIPIFGRNFVSGADRTLEGIDLTPWDAQVWNIKDWRRISR
jgi:peptide/nickel transport system substrate-binding protein